jgi:CheY-like chemotaxis protein
VRLDELVRGMEELIRRTLGPNIALACSAVKGLWVTYADPGQLENALLNLCINARDAMPDGGRLVIDCANRVLAVQQAAVLGLEPGDYLCLSVQDSGAGMAPAVLNKAFDPFFTTKPIGQGTGLGLSMIYGFARQSHGQVKIRSQVGEGTEVSVYLPRHLGEPLVSETVLQPSTEPVVAAGLTVLVVDDEPTVRMLVTEVLGELGYHAVEAADGASGLEVLNSDMRIDLLVTDVGLPGGMNGRQMADAARVARPELKVLFITGYAESAVLNHGHLDPGMQVMTKPFGMEALSVRIAAMIKS